MRRLAFVLLLCPAALRAAQVEAPSFRAAQARFVAELAGPVVPSAPEALRARIAFLETTLETLPAFRLSDPAQLGDRSAMFSITARQLAVLRQARAGKPFDKAQLKGRLNDAQRAARFFDDLSRRDAALSGAAAQARQSYLDHEVELRAQLLPTRRAVQRRMDELARRLGKSRGPGEATAPAAPADAGAPEGPRPSLEPSSPRGPPKTPSAAKRLWSRPAVKVGASVAAAGAFNAFVWLHQGSQAASEFLSTYLIEWTMSLDNLVVIAAVLEGLPKAVRPKVLRLALLGTVLARLGMIAGGIRATAAHEWLFFVFGGFLLTVAAKMLKPEWDLVGFLAGKVKARLKAPALSKLKSPLVAGTLAVILYDVVFALDSVPAALAVSRNVFVVFSANVFAVLGLRSLFSVLEALEERFRHLPKGVAGVLVFVAGKMILEPLLGLHVGALASMAVIVGLLGGSMLASLRRPR